MLIKILRIVGLFISQGIGTVIGCRIGEWLDQKYWERIYNK